MKYKLKELSVQKNIAYVISLILSGLYIVNPLFLIPALATVIASETILPKINKKIREKIFNEDRIKLAMLGKTDEEIDRDIKNAKEKVKENKRLNRSYNRVAYFSYPTRANTYSTIINANKTYKLSDLYELNPKLEINLAARLKRIADSKDYALDERFYSLHKINKELNKYYVIAVINNETLYFSSLDELSDYLISFCDLSTVINEIKIIEYLGNIGEKRFYFEDGEDRFRLIALTNDKTLEYNGIEWIRANLTFDIEGIRKDFEERTKKEDGELLIHSRY